LPRNRIHTQRPVASLRVSDLEVDALHRRAQHGTREVHLTPDEHIILYTLVARTGVVITYRELAVALGQSSVVRNNAFARHVSRLRAKLGDDVGHPHYIETVVGIGYRMRVPTSLHGAVVAKASRIASRILVVEDDIAISNLLQVALGDDGYRVAAAEDGELALGECAIEDPALILLDLHLPGMDGGEFLEAYRARTPAGAKVVVISGAANAAEFARRILADAFIRKPFDIEMLLLTVRGLLPRFQTVDAA
jgi:two-component system response regulator (stage 0 sporulation protein F)